jgi:hypothetical protein
VTAAPLLAALLAASPPVPATAAAASPPAATPTPAPIAAPAQGPDLELHVPRAEVKKVSLEVENLQARLDVDTRVANLVQINAGVVATVQKLKVELDDVAAETHLVVRLDRVAEVMSRALAAIDHDPELAAGPGGVPPARAPVASVAAGAAAEAAPVVAPVVPVTPAAPAGNPTGVKP